MCASKGSAVSSVVLQADVFDLRILLRFETIVLEKRLGRKSRPIFALFDPI